ncbi:MAG: hypothetical protein J6J23_06950 [Clostridia bacterium]|nr:hypothetical protein [Clostridia bacterium]
MKIAKRTSCGANLQIDENQEAGICPYCNAMYSTEKAIKNYNNTTNNTTTNAQVINNYYTAPTPTKTSVILAPQRPKVKIGLALLGFLFYFIPSIIYVASVKSKQSEWDEKYGN